MKNRESESVLRVIVVLTTGLSAIVVFAIGVSLWFPADQSSDPTSLLEQNTTLVLKPAPANQPSSPVMLPPRDVHPENDISIEAYFARFGGVTAVDLKSRKIREGVAEKIREEMVGTQVTWNGYVDRIANAVSGEVTLVLKMTDGPAGLDTALIRFPAALHDQLHAYDKGYHVRVVAVFDEIMTVFPLLSGKSVEWISEG